MILLERKQPIHWKMDSQQQDASGQRTSKKRASHPTPEELRRYWLEDVTDARRRSHLFVHLNRCEACRNVILQLGQQPLYILDRPVLAELPARPTESESKIQGLVNGCKGEPDSQMIRVGADGGSEAYLYHVLSVTAARLRSMGRTVAFEGVINCSTAPAPRPDANVAILLNAPSFEDLGDWRSAADGQSIVLAGLASDWAECGVTPDLQLVAGGRSANSHSGIMDGLLKTLFSGDPERCAALLMVAAGCDIPLKHFPWLAADGTFRRIKASDAAGSEWCSVPGAWHLAQLIRSLPANTLDIDGFTAEVRARIAREPELLRRFCYLSEKRNLTFSCA